MNWQKIETAPKDEIIDIWTAREKRLTDCWWGERSADEAQRKEFGFDKIGWCWMGDDYWCWPVEDATHWMPLPPPPEPDIE